MTSRRLTRQSTNDSDLNRVQANMLQVLNPVLANPLFDGVLLENVFVDVSVTDIPHKLGRKWRGYILVKHPDIGTLFDSVSGDDTKFLRLTAPAAATTVSLWVF